MENAAVAGWKLWMSQRAVHRKQVMDQPNDWMRMPLTTRARVEAVHLGSGSQIYASILPEIEKAEEEVILVTCFWARSDTLNQVNNSLRKLSGKGRERGRKIVVRICFSSLSLWQKLFHTRSLTGREYPQSMWQKTLGLPAPEELQGIQLSIKSIFVLPFSVMHPKFIIVDSQRVFLPSCNISWENWFEGCVELSGPVTEHFVQFWQSFWAPSSGRLRARLEDSTTPEENTSPAIFLPSPHHALSIFDGLKSYSPPTPLNLCILSVLQHANRSIYIQTPNMTSRVVLEGIHDALRRGINVRIVTSERLMILEQLVTARTTTARCMKWLAGRHEASLLSGDEEALMTIGTLEIAYYEARPPIPDQSHIKLTICDDELIVLGSGNLDRASWVTSQELGVAITDSAFVRSFKSQLDGALKGRLRLLYPSP